MFVTRSIEADHKDLIHDVAYDFYGKRLATCSSDQSVKVWDMTVDGNWKCTASWKTHSGSVWKVTWAHPEFGQVLATCSFDRTAAIWEELIVEGSGGERNQSHWVKRATLVDSRTSVTDVKFAPKHLGLQVATCSSDGMLRIYEAPDIMNICQWQLQHDIRCRMACSCVTWSPSRMHSTMIAVGSDDHTANCGKVIIFEYSDNQRKWSQVEVIAFITDPVNDIAFAPNLGWSYNYIAVATGEVKIVSIKSAQEFNNRGALNSSFLSSSNSISPQSAVSSGTGSGSAKYEIKQVMQSSDHGAPVWRVSWNVTGTILASSGDDGTVRLWKANYLDNWKCIAMINGESFNASNNLSAVNAPNASIADIDSRSRARFYKFGAIDDPKNVPWH